MISICIIESIKFESRTETDQPEPPATLPGTRPGLVLVPLSHLLPAPQPCLQPAGRNHGPLLVGTRTAASLSPPPSFAHQESQTTTALLSPGLWGPEEECHGALTAQ